jgi:SAM-dependent methyltransferase
VDSQYGHSGRYDGAEGEQYFAWQSAGQEVGGLIDARKFVQYVRETDTVLDFGCGGGFILKSIRCQRRIGVEINPVARAAASIKGLECYEDLSDVSDSVADIVISNHALEHVPNPIGAIKEMVRVLKSGGQLVLVLPIDDWRTQLRYNPTDINHHLYTWTPQLIGNTLMESGFRSENLVRISVLTYAWFPGYVRAFPALPEWLFDFGCRLFGLLFKRRELVAIVRKD